MEYFRSVNATNHQYLGNLSKVAWYQFAKQDWKNFLVQLLLVKLEIKLAGLERTYLGAKGQPEASEVPGGNWESQDYWRGLGTLGQLEGRKGQGLQTKNLSQLTGN